MCGIAVLAGGFNPEILTNLSLRAALEQQHRGQENAGILYSNGKWVYYHKGKGLVGEVLNADVMAAVKKRQPVMVCLHTRYATTKGPLMDEKKLSDAQPHFLDLPSGRIGIVGNGDVSGLARWQEELEKEGVICYTYNDSEFLLRLIAHIIIKERPDWRRDVIHGITRMMETVKASYSAAIMTGSRCYVYRDPKENRPLWFGKLEGMFLAASETCVFDALGATVEREVRGGEILVVEPDGNWHSIQAVERQEPKHCIFCKIYFARPDSRAFGEETNASFRRRLGYQLWQCEQALGNVPDVDFVASIPASGDFIAEGYALARGMLLRSAFLRNPYILRTFIMNKPELRKDGVRAKLHALLDVAEGITAADGRIVIPGMRRGVYVDDSIVRGTTLGVLAQIIKESGIPKPHIRIGSPQIIGTCENGMDFKDRSELIGAWNKPDAITKIHGLGSLLHLPIDQLDEVIRQGGENPAHYCHGCFLGNNPLMR